MRSVYQQAARVLAWVGDRHCHFEAPSLPAAKIIHASEEILEEAPSVRTSTAAVGSSSQCQRIATSRPPNHSNNPIARLFQKQEGEITIQSMSQKIQYFSNHFFENLVSSPEFLSACASKLIVYSKNMKTAYYWDSTSCFRIQYGHGSGSSKNFNLLERWCLSERTEAFLLKTWSAPGRLSTCIIGSCSKPLAVHLPSGAFGSSKRKPRDPWRPCYSSQVFSIVIGRHEAFSSCFEPQVFLKLQIHGTASLHFRNFQRSNRTSDLPRLL